MECAGLPGEDHEGAVNGWGWLLGGTLIDLLGFMVIEMMRHPFLRRKFNFNLVVF